VRKVSGVAGAGSRTKVSEAAGIGRSKYLRLTAG
jgi:hypothetical protein